MDSATEHVDKLKTFVTHLHLITLQNELLGILYVYRIQEVKKIPYGFELFKIKDMNNVSKSEKKLWGKLIHLKEDSSHFLSYITCNIYQRLWIEKEMDCKTATDLLGLVDNEKKLESEAHTRSPIQT